MEGIGQGQVEQAASTENDEMADTSVFTIEERLVACVWVHERPKSGKTMDKIMDDFVVRFGKPSPNRKTLLTWSKKAFVTGSVLDAPRCGRPSTRVESCAAVEESIQRSPMKSTRKRSAELDIPRSTMMDYVRKDLKMKCFRPVSVNELSDGDLEKRIEACRLMLHRFRTGTDKSNVLFSDECAIYRSTRNRNVYFWAKENPHFYEEIENNPPHVMIWAGVTGKHLFGPYFFDGSVNQETYLRMLNEWLFPQLRATGLMETVTFQQDGATPHFALSVRRCLNQVFPNRWIGRGSDNAPAPLPWPPRSPDLTTPDNALWGIIKEEVRKHRYTTNDQLKEAVRAAFTTITPDLLKRMNKRTWRRINLCVENGGMHTDVLDP